MTDTRIATDHLLFTVQAGTIVSVSSFTVNKEVLHVALSYLACNTLLLLSLKSVISRTN